MITRKRQSLRSSCREEVINCNCTLSFDSYVNNSISVLSVGNLIGGDDCVFDEYVIDWYRDGEHALVSGIGDNPEIEAYHPFLGAASIPVIAGTWVPRVRYVVIDGERVFAQRTPCQKWCSMLQNLPVIIVVNPLTCETTSYPVTAGYSYQISYTSAMDYSMAGRTIRFDLPADRSAYYFAFRFQGFTVADKIEIFFKNSITPLTSWIVGLNVPVMQYNTMPYEHNNNELRYVFALPRYSAGDYLIIKITPAVYDINPNTIWTLDLKCLDADTDWGCNHVTPEMQEIVDISVENNIENCQEEFTLTFREMFGRYDSSNPMYNLMTYAGLAGLLSGIGIYQPDIEAKQLKLYTPNRLNSNTRVWVSGASSNVLVNCTSALHINKVGNVTTFQCTSIEDYNSFTSSYSGLVSSEFITGFVNDNTDYKYYRYWNIQIREAATNCGDVYTQSYTAYFHPTAVFVFDPVLMKIEVTTSEIVSGLTPVACDSNYNTALVYTNYINNYHNLADYSITTMCRQNRPLGYSFGLIGPGLAPTNQYLGFYAAYIRYPVLTPCGDIPMFCTHPAYYWFYQNFYYYMLGITYTGALPRHENFEIRSWLGDDGCFNDNALTRPLIYKVEGGVVTVNNLPYKPKQS